MKLILLTFLIISCSREKPKQQPTFDEKVQAVTEKLEDLKIQADHFVDENGWPVSESCDAMLWAGKYCTAFPDYVDITAAEIDGKFFRTPAKSCLDDFRSASTFSRDMSMGLLSCLVAKKDLEAIERHIEYGETHSWVMGEGPLSRTAYSPSLIGLWHKAARNLGHDYNVVEVGNLYPSGLIDYQAHLQVMDIYLRHKLVGFITQPMINRLNEHGERKPNSVFYKTMQKLYLGELSEPINLCLDDHNIVGEYVRCDGEACELVERIFACNLILESLRKRVIE